MQLLTVLTKAAGDMLLLFISLADIGALFNNDKLREEVLQYEKLRRAKLSRHIRKISGDTMHKDSEQRPTILPRTRRILSVQARQHAESEYYDIGPRVDPSEHVRNEPSTVRARKRVLHINNRR